MERSALDAQQIIALRESMGRARQRCDVGRGPGRVGRVRSRGPGARGCGLARVGQAICAMPAPRWIAHSASISTKPARRQASCPASSPNTRTAPTQIVQSRRVRRELLTRYSGLLTGMDMRVRTSIEQAGTSRAVPPRVNPCSRFARSSTRCAQRSRRGAHSMGVSWTQARSPVRNEISRPRCATGRRACGGHQGADWYHAMTGDMQALTTTRVALFRNEERRMAAVDAFARESRKLAALLPARFPEAPPEASPQQEAATPASVSQQIRAPTAPWWRG